MKSISISSMYFKVIFGGGLRNFLLKSDGGLREDRDLINEYKNNMEGKDSRYLQTKDDFNEWIANGTSEHVLGELKMYK